MASGLAPGRLVLAMRNPKRKRPRESGDTWQPDLFGGRGILRPAWGDDPKEEAKQARREMMDTGSPTLFDFLKRDKDRNLSALCPCDEACCGARGPDCDCRCGGANHGITRSNPRLPVRRNLDAFTDEHGIHPIRYSPGYDEAKAGEKALDSWRDFDLEGKRVAYAARKQERREVTRARRTGLKDIRQHRKELKRQLAEVREAQKARKETSEGLDRPTWARGWRDEELMQVAESGEGSKRSAFASDWHAGVDRKHRAEFRDLSKRGSFRQQLDRQATALKTEIKELDRLAAAVGRAHGRRRNPEPRAEGGWGSLGLLAAAVGGLLWVAGRGQPSSYNKP